MPTVLNPKSGPATSSHTDGKNPDVKQSHWTKTLLFSSITAAMGSFIFGFNISVIDAPSEIFTQCTMDSGRFPVCVNVHGYWNLVVTIFCIGGLIGSLSSSFFTNRVGRQRSILYNCCGFIIGGLFMSLSQNLAMLLVGRFLIGLASGFVTCAVPTYLAEISSDNIRGRIASLHQCMLVIGIIFAQILAFPLVSPGLSTWRILFFMTTALASIQLVLLFFVPESPVFLVTKGKMVSAEDSLKRLRGLDDVKEDLSRLQKGCTQSDSTKIFSIFGLLACKKARKSVFVASFSHFAQQLSGINAYFFYALTIFGSISLPFSLKIVPLMLGIVNALVSCSSVFFIDRTGRRPLLLISTLVCCISTFSIIIGFLFGLTLLKVFSAVIFVAGFAIGLGPVPWIIVGDIFPPEAISAGMSLTLTVNWLSNSMVAFGTEMLFTLLGPFAFAPFLIILFAYLPFTLIYIKETKGTVPNFLV